MSTAVPRPSFPMPTLGLPCLSALSVRLALLLAFQLGCLRAAEFSVFVNGARGDGKTVSTQAIQATIDAAAADGGGTVVFPTGTYLTGALFLKSGVELRLDEGVTLSAVRSDDAYPESRTRVAGIEMDWPAAVVNVNGQRNVKITGPGTIDGQGDFWWSKFWGEDRKGGMLADYNARKLRWAADYDCKRVRGVAIYDSKDVEVNGVTILRPGFWSLVMTYSERVTVRNVIIRANMGERMGPSSDGIDVDSSRDILIEGCDIDCNDDNICLKAGRDADGLRVNRPTENVIVRDCITRAGHGMFVIGSETSGGIRNVEVSNLRAIGTKYGIRFKSAKIRGGIVENIRISGIRMENVPKPIHFELNWNPSYSYPTLPAGMKLSEAPVHWKVMMQKVEPEARGIPLFRKISIRDVEATGADGALYVNAYREKPLAELSLEDVRIEAKTAGSVKSGSLWTMRNVRLLLDEVVEKVPYEACYDVPQPLIEKRR